MGTNLFSQQPPSSNGLSDFERGLSTDAFQHGGPVKTAGLRPKPKRKIFDPPLPANTDFYPGHEGYLFIAQELLGNIKRNFIWLPADSVTAWSKNKDGVKVTGASVKASKFNLGKHNDTAMPFYEMTADELVTALVRRFRDDKGPPGNLSNWEWCDPDETISPRAELEEKLKEKLKEALKSPQGFPSNLDPRVNPLGFRADSWDTWAGRHWGYWLSDYADTYLDTAEWERTTQVPTDDPDDLPDSTTGKPRLYDHQHVTWRERPVYKTSRGDYSHHGWNNSHPDVSYLWGWDPKDWDTPINIKYPGTWGVHVGFPFLSDGDDDIRFILWLTPTEVFLETVNLSRKDDLLTIEPKITKQFTTNPKTWKPKTMTIDGGTFLGHPKSSTSLNGRGQWVIEKSF